MKQYVEMKSKHPDAVLLFRVGDFYETFSEDAIAASEILGITLTRRANGAAQYVELAGFPHHALDVYLPKLIRAGKRVAICEQLEDPKLTKKLVKRGITELVTPGVAMNDNVLCHKENNFLASVYFDRHACGVAFLDISTGEFLTAEGGYDHIDKLLNSFSPKEVLVERGKREVFESRFGHRFLVFELDDWIYTSDAASQRLLKHFGTKSMKGFGVQHLKLGLVASGAVLYYMDITQHTSISHIVSLRRIEEERFVRLDKFSLRSLELLGTMNEGGKSLLDVIDRTVSPMGGRLLKRWLTFPLKDVAALNRRLDTVEFFFRNPEVKETVQRQLSCVGDLERLTSKIAVGRITPREMYQLKVTLAALPDIVSAFAASGEEGMAHYAEEIDLCADLCGRIERVVMPDAPMLLNRGGVIRGGVDAQLDELRELSGRSKEYLLRIQQEESERTGIPSLKIGFNNVFGYYIEVRNTHRDKVPAEWIRKQTLTSAERYITQELKEYEEKILGAEEKILSIEARLFGELVSYAAGFIPLLQRDSVLLARLDCLVAFSVVSAERCYVRPVLDDSLCLDIEEGRHPVIETQLPPGEEYVSNSIHLDNDGEQIMIVTGPNMAGKSALLRQTALIVIMAQIGCFVPAASARIGIVDKVFTRVGASDNISLGESTFMVEMTEAADILNNLSERSLVLFDELGRGTSTYDGISIAWAIVEHIHENERAHAKTLFATHYHELNEMEKDFKRVVNYNVSVKEVDNKVVFLRKLVRGGSEHSFGIHVAKMAGMPQSIVKRADEILKQLEKGGEGKGIAKPLPEAKQAGGVQLSLYQLDDPVLSCIRNEIVGLDINNLTPIEALNKLNDIKKILLGR